MEFSARVMELAFNANEAFDAIRQNDDVLVSNYLQGSFDYFCDRFVAEYQNAIDEPLRREHNANHDGRQIDCKFCRAFMERTDRAIKLAGREATYIRKVIRALKAAGTPIVSVWDGEEDTPVKTERDILELVYNLDQCHLYTESGSWIFVVTGNAWYEVINDNTTDLSDVLREVEDWADSKN